MGENIYKTEFFETAVSLGFYGIDRAGMFGKKDHVRKYWEDIFTKLMIRRLIADLLERKNGLRIIDLGCGSGEGFELLTHIPMGLQVEGHEKGFLLTPERIETYVGLDISESMVAQGSKNYSHRSNVRFRQHDLSNGFPLSSEPPFDIYFSSYSSLSHLTKPQLAKMVEQVCSCIDDRAIMIFDMFGRLSPEWPIYWNRTNEEMLEYNMAYLFPPEKRNHEKVEAYQVCFWTADELAGLIRSAAAKKGRKVKLSIKDRSIFVGRHMDTGIFNGFPQSLRYQVNRLFDHDRRGQIDGLKIDISFLDSYKDIQPKAYARIAEYSRQWNTVITTLEALMKMDDATVAELITPAPPELGDELKMIAWLFRNATRFPSVDFWASVMGPQIACVLRNLEFNLPEGIGCGHGLMCVAEISK
jgi:SAM-dependent methyltransferase